MLFKRRRRRQRNAKRREGIQDTFKRKYFIGVFPQSGANLINMSNLFHDKLKSIEDKYPKMLKL
jgi:hypothetical protein